LDELVLDLKVSGLKLFGVYKCLIGTLLNSILRERTLRRTLCVSNGCLNLIVIQINVNIDLSKMTCRQVSKLD
jgi:hypothetical protein